MYSTGVAGDRYDYKGDTRAGHGGADGIHGTSRSEAEPDDSPDAGTLVAAYVCDGMDSEALHEAGTSADSGGVVCGSAWYRPFYAYYQLGGKDESDEAETEPRKEGELRTEYESFHSPFGFVWQIAAATGWSVDYILNGVNYQTLILMMSDAPRYVRRRAGKTGSCDGNQSSEQEADEIVGFFRSRLNVTENNN